jgi:hypothetical protein
VVVVTGSALEMLLTMSYLVMGTFFCVEDYCRLSYQAANCSNYTEVLPGNLPIWR